MEEVLKRVCINEFKEQAAQLVVMDGLGLTEAARCFVDLSETLAKSVAGG